MKKVIVNGRRPPAVLAELAVKLDEKIDRQCPRDQSLASVMLIIVEANAESISVPARCECIQCVTRRAIADWLRSAEFPNLDALTTRLLGDEAAAPEKRH